MQRIISFLIFCLLFSELYAIKNHSLVKDFFAYPAYTIFEIRDGGKFIVLNDGSVWLVSLNFPQVWEQRVTANWNVGDEIRPFHYRRNGEQMIEFVKLVNYSNSETAIAYFYTQEYNTEVVRIDEFDQGSHLIRLTNGAVFKISSPSIFENAKEWKRRQPIVVLAVNKHRIHLDSDPFFAQSDELGQSYYLLLWGFFKVPARLLCPPS